jgi:uncharacterized small protein (DUF1192 family)
MNLWQWIKSRVMGEKSAYESPRMSREQINSILSSDRQHRSQPSSMAIAAGWANHPLVRRKEPEDKLDYSFVAEMESRIAQLKLDREKAVKAKKKHSHYDNEIRSLRSAILKAEQAGWR